MKVEWRVCWAGLALIVLAGCADATSSSGPTPAAAVPTATAASAAGTGGSALPSSPSPVALAPTATAAPALGNGELYLADMSSWNAALAKIPAGAALTSPTVVTAGTQAVAASRLLLSQTWPANATSDIHAFAVQLDTINEDIQTNNLNKFNSDLTSLKADAQVVRADLGLPPIS